MGGGEVDVYYDRIQLEQFLKFPTHGKPFSFYMTRFICLLQCKLLKYATDFLD